MHHMAGQPHWSSRFLTWAVVVALVALAVVIHYWRSM